MQLGFEITLKDTTYGFLFLSYDSFRKLWNKKILDIKISEFRWHPHLLMWSFTSCFCSRNLRASSSLSMKSKLPYAQKQRTYLSESCSVGRRSSSQLWGSEFSPQEAGCGGLVTAVLGKQAQVGLWGLQAPWSSWISEIHVQWDILCQKWPGKVHSHVYIHIYI